MEYSAIRDHLKYINSNGLTLSIEERMNLDLALQKLHLDFGFEELLLWGKINGKLHFSNVTDLLMNRCCERLLRGSWSQLRWLQ